MYYYCKLFQPWVVQLSLPGWVIYCTAIFKLSTHSSICVYHVKIICCNCKLACLYRTIRCLMRWSLCLHHKLVQIDVLQRLASEMTTLHCVGLQSKCFHEITIIFTPAVNNSFMNRQMFVCSLRTLGHCNITTVCPKCRTMVNALHYGCIMYSLNKKSIYHTNRQV